MAVESSSTINVSIMDPSQTIEFQTTVSSLEERLASAQQQRCENNTDYVNLRDYYFPTNHPLPLYGPEGQAIKNWRDALVCLAQSKLEEEAVEFWINLQTSRTGVNRIYAGVKILYEIGENNPFSIFTLPTYGDFGTLVHPPCIYHYNLPFLFNIFNYSVVQVPNIPGSHTFSLLHNSLQI